MTELMYPSKQVAFLGRKFFSDVRRIVLLSHVFSLPIICVWLELFQIEKIVVGSPAADAGLKVRDFLVSVQGQKVLEMTHHQVVQLIKNAGNTLNLDIERFVYQLL